MEVRWGREKEEGRAIAIVARKKYLGAKRGLCRGIQPINAGCDGKLFLLGSK